MSAACFILRKHVLLHEISRRAQSVFKHGIFWLKVSDKTRMVISQLSYLIGVYRISFRNMTNWNDYVSFSWKNHLRAIEKK